MNRPPFRLDHANLVNATWRAHEAVEHVRKLAEQHATDPRRLERLAKQECVYCFYGTRIGGAACTSRPCGGCGETILSGSTNIDALCQPCARKHTLCKHCGADLLLRTGRRKWPTNSFKPLNEKQGT